MAKPYLVIKAESTITKAEARTVRFWPIRIDYYMKQLTIDDIEKVGGANFCSGMITGTFTGVGALLGAGAGVGVASVEGAWAGAELGGLLGTVVSSGICGE